MISHNSNVRWKVVSIVSLPQHLLSLFPNAFSLSPRNGNSVCLSVPGFFVIGFSYIFWSQDFRDFFLSGFSSLLHLLVKSDHFNRFLTIVIIITIVLITNGFFTTVFQQCDVCVILCALSKRCQESCYYHTNHNQNGLSPKCVAVFSQNVVGNHALKRLLAAMWRCGIFKWLLNCLP